MPSNDEQFRITISRKRRIVDRWNQADHAWVMLGQASDATGAEAIIDSWNNGTWTPRFG